MEECEEEELRWRHLEQVFQGVEVAADLAVCLEGAQDQEDVDQAQDLWFGLIVAAWAMWIGGWECGLAERWGWTGLTERALATKAVQHWQESQEGTRARNRRQRQDRPTHCWQLSVRREQPQQLAVLEDSPMLR